MQRISDRPCLLSANLKPLLRAQIAYLALD
ncbi:hypothetical protein FHT32_006504 [Variovorax sp. SG517]|nr:hypothetical protein [Variovorax sp. SG517]